GPAWQIENQHETAQCIEREDVAVVQQEAVRQSDREQKPQPAPIDRLRNAVLIRDRRIVRDCSANRPELQRGAQAEQKREDRNEFAGDKRADQQVRRHVTGRRNRQELTEWIAAAPDERLDIDLQYPGKRKCAKRVDEFDALSPGRRVTQSALRPFARSSP